MGKLWGEVEWAKVACCSTKAAIFLKRVKIEEKLLWRAYRNSPTLFWTVQSRPSRPPLPQDWGFATPPKTPIAIISGTGKATDFKFDQYIYRVHPNKSPWKFWRKGSVGVSRDCPNFWGTPIISETGKATNFRPDSVYAPWFCSRPWRYTNHLLTYLLTSNFVSTQ